MTTSKGMDLTMLVERFHSEDRCRDYLEGLRWPDGVRCLRCDSDRISRITTRHLFQCMACDYQFSVRAGTILHDSKLPLWKWFATTYLMVESKKGISSNQLKRMLGVSYKTAWFLSHRIRHGMGLVVQEQLRGIVEADETFVGGKKRNSLFNQFGERRTGRMPGDPKTVVLGAVERGGDVRMRVAPNRKRPALKAFLEQYVSDDAAAVFTDEYRGYRTLIADEDTRHESVNHSAEEWVRGDVHTNTIENVWSLLKRSIIGSYHHVSVKHLDGYLDELEWRYTNRDNDFLFRDTIMALVEADRLEYKVLTA